MNLLELKQVIITRAKRLKTFDVPGEALDMSVLHLIPLVYKLAGLSTALAIITNFRSTIIKYLNGSQLFLHAASLAPRLIMGIIILLGSIFVTRLFFCTIRRHKTA